MKVICLSIIAMLAIFVSGLSASAQETSGPQVPLEDAIGYLTEMYEAAESVKTLPQSEAARVLSGACHLRRGTVRTCFDNFTPAQCRQAAQSCNCFASHVPGGRCPSN